MPKFKKSPKKSQKLEQKPSFNEDFMFKSVKISTILGGIFLIISFFFNIGIITIFMNRDVFWDVIDVSIKVSSILLCFFFMMISIGNYKDLTGKPSDWKMILLLFSLSLAQTIRNLVVFLFTLLGLVLIIIYLYFIKENLNK